MDDSTKIQHLKHSIKFEAGLKHALTTVRTAGLFQGTFTNFVSFLQGEVDAKNNRKKVLRGVSVKSTETDKKNKNNPGPIPFEKVDNKIVQGRHYQDHEWKSLTPKQRAAVIPLQRQRRGKNKNNKLKNISATQTFMSKIDVDSISQAIIVGISRGSTEEGDHKSDDVSKVPEISDSTSNKRAKSGQVGNFLSAARKSA